MITLTDTAELFACSVAAGIFAGAAFFVITLVVTWLLIRLRNS